MGRFFIDACRDDGRVSMRKRERDRHVGVAASGPDGSALRFDEMFDDREAEAGAAGRALTRRVGAIEADRRCAPVDLA